MAGTLETYAVTTKGWHLKHNLTHRDRNMIITANGDSILGHSYKQVWKNDNDGRGSLRPTAEELRDPDAGKGHFLVVGLAVRPGAVKVDLAKAIEGTKRKTVGISPPQAGEIVTIDSEVERNVLTLVVSPVKPGQGKVSLGALLQQSKGLCTPYNIPNREVFYFDEFRDGSTSHPDRISAWNAMVGSQSNRGINSNPDTEKPRRFKRIKTSANSSLEPKKGIASDLKSLMASYMISEDVTVLKDMKKVFEAAEPSVQRQPPTGAASILKFIDIDEDFQEEDATQMQADVSLWWPQLSHIDPKSYSVLRRGLKESNTILVSGYLRGFLAEGSRRISSMNDFDSDSFDYASFVEDILSSVTTILEPESILPISKELQPLISSFLSLGDKMREIIRDTEDFERKVNEYLEEM